MENTLGKTIKTFNSRMQARLLLVFCVIAILMIGLMGRLIYIMQADGDRGRLLIVTELY
jgi:stage V sporulation protein D (sporulation-specific penicillin-binding protein)